MSTVEERRKQGEFIQVGFLVFNHSIPATVLGKVQNEA